ncbi:hypothetical protein PU629_18790 [Pullulanibacillus sp. KACC 23026]|uniref:CBO0543 family protein n=1 Tax=Pullulanibacillus sp. KACC 23026 TaxID=3028315 RepID=UPI0023AF8B6C|nr:CBO0543 family protein [Pullulanibacillus sp. KACC 23026]WEG12141.1 hypothetical protein PU629_18790 [Pullulanibacillus sp. KACC 23026]
MTNREFVHRIRQYEQEKSHLEINQWLHHDLFSARWWLLLLFLIVPWVIWMLLRKKELYLESAFIGCYAIALTLFIDSIGSQFNFWRYPTKFLPVIPSALPFDLSLVPVMFMFIYQYCQSWRTYWKTLLVISLMYAFIGEPVCIYLQLVIYINWSIYYSFGYYLIVGFSARALVLLLKRKRKEKETV